MPLTVLSHITAKATTEQVNTKMYRYHFMMKNQVHFH